MDRLNDMLNKLREMFAEKEPLRKKFLNVEKNVSKFYFSQFWWSIALYVTYLAWNLVDQKLVWLANEVNKDAQRGRRNVHQEVCWSSQLCLLWEGYHQPLRPASRLSCLEETPLQRAIRKDCKSKWWWLVLNIYFMIVRPGILENSDYDASKRQQ